MLINNEPVANHGYPVLALFAKIKLSRKNLNLQFVNLTGADSGFLERGFICINVLGFALLILSHFS